MFVLDVEFIKFSILGMLVICISYMNDLVDVVEKLGIDIVYVWDGMVVDSWIGELYLYLGVGFGGENFLYDILILLNIISNIGIKS